MAYINKQVKPIITASTQNTQFANNDILFDWTAFDLPKGSSLLKNVTAVLRHADTAAQTMQHIHLFFARSIDGVVPASLGAVNATASGTGYFNNIIAGIILDKADALIDGLDFVTILSSGNASGSAGGMGSTEIAFSTDDFTTAVSKGFERYYVAAIHHGGTGLNFTTGVLLNQGSNQAAAAVETTLTTDGTDARKVFSVGDVVVAADGAAVGTVTAVASATSLTVDAVEAALEDDDELLVQSPVGLQLSFEHGY